MFSKLFLGQASNYRAKDVFSHLFAFGTSRSSTRLKEYLMRKYDASAAFLMQNGRSALTLGLKQLLPEGGEVIINGFTCYAVVQAVERAGCKPVYADINERTLNFDVKTLEKTLEKHPRARALIIQNTLGITVDITKIEKFAKNHNLKIVEDLAHCAGFKYPDGREVGSVGNFSALSFGKGKSLDTITGGALVINDAEMLPLRFSNRRPKVTDGLRARFYPLFGAIGRAFSELHVEKYWYGPLIRMHFIERAVDAKIDLSQRLSHWQAGRALKQLQDIDINGAKPIRTHRLVKNRADVVQALDDAGFNFREIWYDVPVSPVRYYKNLDFPEEECPVATKVASEIINLPTYYPDYLLSPALKIIEEYER